MSKTIQPISDPDELRRAAQEVSTESFSAPATPIPATPQPVTHEPALNSPISAETPSQQMGSAHKVVEPLASTTEIREEAEEAVTEKFTDYYVDAAAPDPLSWQPPVATAQTQPDPTIEVAAEAQANDPLNFQSHPLAKPVTELDRIADTEASSAAANDPLANP